jgi:retron-type reverse transcriptase
MVPKVPKILDSIRKRNMYDLFATNKDLYKLVCNKELLAFAYHSMQSKSASIHNPIEKLSSHPIFDQTIEEISDELRSQKWKFKRVKKEPMSKSNCFYGIPSFKDQIVQKAILLIIKSIYEPGFLKHTHGFKQDPNQHTALKEIQSYWSGMKFAIEGEMDSCNINHHILITTLRRKIKDEKFIQLIWKLNKTGLNFHDKKLRSEGRDLRPILIHIYLNNFHHFVEKISKAYSTNRNSKHISIGYIRYQEKWIIGINGPRKLVVKLKRLIELYLKVFLKLRLYEGKLKINPFSTTKIVFLDFRIQILANSGTEWNDLMQTKLYMPMDKILRKLKDNHFCTTEGRGVGKKGWLSYSDKRVIIKYNYLLKSLRYYYSPADNYQTSFHRIQNIILYSCAHTLAKKHKSKISLQMANLRETI